MNYKYKSNSRNIICFHNIRSSVLTVSNPEGTAIALTITPNTGGTETTSAHSTIIHLQ